MSEPLPHTLRGIAGPVTIVHNSQAVGGGMQTAVTIRPDVTVEPVSIADIVRAVDHAASHEIPLRVSSTGHGATSSEGGLLIRTHRLTEVHIDPQRRTADVAPGVTWSQVAAAAARHGLMPLSGTAGTVGAVGYTVGGGISPLSRAYGYAADHVLDLDVVTPDGRLRTLTAETEPELFWAARGAGANLGIVTRLRFRLFPFAHLHAGALTIALDDWAEVAGHYLDWTTRLPPTIGSFLSLKNFPDDPHLPEPIRGKRTATIYLTSLDAPSDLATALEPVRRLPLAVDTVAGITATELTSVFNEPTWPHAFQGDAVAAMGIHTSAWTSTLPQLSVGVDLPTFVFVHHLGGAMSTVPDAVNVVGNRAAPYLVRVVTSPTPDTDATTIAVQQDAALRSLSVLPTGRIGNFLFGDNLDTAPISDCYESTDLPRLIDLVSRVDPDGILRPARGRMNDHPKSPWMAPAR